MFDSYIHFASSSDAQLAASSVAGSEYGYPYTIFYPADGHAHETIHIRASEQMQPVLGDFYPRCSGYVSAEWDIEEPDARAEYSDALRKLKWD